MGFIENIGTALPKDSLTQDEFYSIYVGLTHDKVTKRKLRFLLSRSHIDKRHCVNPNILSLLDSSIDQKMALYHEKATSLAQKAVENNSAFTHPDSFTDLIVVSCTGMQAPGIEIELIQQLGLSHKISRYNVNFMGCYAAITALRMANDICQNPNRKVLIISVELCTLHFQNNFTDDYLLSNSIFADGAASIVVSSEKEKGKLELKKFESRLITDAKDKMSWKISTDGFLMTLSNEVPQVIRKSLEENMLFNASPDAVNWAIHPGGRQIVDGLASSLNLSEQQVNHSRNVLREYGNMSSATLCFVLNALINDQSSSKLDTISCAFGPGLTLESAYLKHV